MPLLTPEELEKMHETLKKAYACASRNFTAYLSYDDSSDGKRKAGAQVSAAATALLLADERLDQVGPTANVSKSCLKPPGKT